MAHEVSFFLADYTDANPPKMRLECVLSWRLHGTVQSMRAVKLAGSDGRAALVLAFLDARVALVEYDPAAHDVKTISLHVFEVSEWNGCSFTSCRDARPRACHPCPSPRGRRRNRWRDRARDGSELRRPLGGLCPWCLDNNGRIRRRA